jgi:hypothetical protein
MRFGIELTFLHTGNLKWPARLTGAPMIHVVLENKYRFNMQVSARAMGSRDRSPPATGRQRGTINSGIFDQRIALAAANRRLKQIAAQNCCCFASASQIRDLPGRMASTGDRNDGHHQQALRSPSRTEQPEPSS